MKSVSFKFLADECCDQSLVDSLRRFGHDVSYAMEIYRGLDDDFILNAAFNEGRILLTEDKDFGELIYRLRKPAKGVILIRMDAANKLLKWQRLKKLIDEFGGRLTQKFVVVDARKFRFRPLLFKL